MENIQNNLPDKAEKTGEDIPAAPAETVNNSANSPAKDKASSRSVAFLAVILIIITIFISATFGAFFGFLASRSGSPFLAGLGGGKLSSLLAGNNSTPSSEVTKQNIVQEDSAVIDVVKKTSPAVVSIVISKDISNTQNLGDLPNFFGDPFNLFFGQGNGMDNGNNNNGSNSNGGNSNSGSGSQQQTIGGGTGFFITSDGLIVTNRHVVDDSTASYTVVTNDNKKYPAKVLAIDPVNDIAVIKIDGSGFPTLKLGNSSQVQVGETVIAIGNSLGQFSNTVSRGIISGLQRNVTAGGDTGQTERLTNIIQTDAAINPGNSGGPLLDINGNVIGINVAIAQDAQNIGFAIPSNQVKKVVNEVETTGKISTPYLGIRYIPIDSGLQQQNNLPYDYGDLVTRGQTIGDLAVILGSPADKAGIVENDIILEVNGTKINDGNGGPGLSDLIAQHNVGDTVTLKVWSKGQTKDVPVTLAQRPNNVSNTQNNPSGSGNSGGQGQQ
jgi:S1-C subfamily serine protease